MSAAKWQSSAENRPEAMRDIGEVESAEALVAATFIACGIGISWIRRSCSWNGHIKTRNYRAD
jgi:hypothetical protein